MTYQAKPVLIDVIQFTRDNVKEVLKFTEGKASIVTERCPNRRNYCSIDTPQGKMKALEGNFIIKGTNGEFYPCKPDIFKKAYESVEWF